MKYLWKIVCVLSGLWSDKMEYSILGKRLAEDDIDFAIKRLCAGVPSQNVLFTIKKVFVDTAQYEIAERYITRLRHRHDEDNKPIEARKSLIMLACIEMKRHQYAAASDYFIEAFNKYPQREDSLEDLMNALVCFSSNADYAFAETVYQRIILRTQSPEWRTSANWLHVQIIFAKLLMINNQMVRAAFLLANVKRYADRMPDRIAAANVINHMRKSKVNVERLRNITYDPIVLKKQTTKTISFPELIKIPEFKIEIQSKSSDRPVILPTIKDITSMPTPRMVKLFDQKINDCN